MPVRSPPKIRARQITDADLGGVVEFLKKGFGRKRTLRYWKRGLDRIGAHVRPDGTPQYGYLMEHDNLPVGVILLIHSRVRTDDGWAVRCNLSSWNVAPAFRSHAPLLAAQAMKRKDVVTYVNISPVRHTLPIVEAQGFTRYAGGQFATVTWPSGLARSPARIVAGESEPDARFEPFERDLLRDHARYGCISLWCATTDRAHPFVFAPRILKGIVPCVQLIYCRDVEEYVEFSRPLGSYLAAHGRCAVLIDANGPIRGLLGRYIDGWAPKYFKGPIRPRLGDLAYTEAALFGM
jgi:hypothetical protein